MIKAFFANPLTFCRKNTTKILHRYTCFINILILNFYTLIVNRWWITFPQIVRGNKHKLRNIKFQLKQEQSFLIGGKNKVIQNKILDTCIWIKNNKNNK